MNGLAGIARALRSGRFAMTRLGDGSGVLLDIEGNQVLSLNETGMFLLDAIAAGTAGEDALLSAMLGAFDVDETTARADLDRFLAELRERLA